MLSKLLSKIRNLINPAVVTANGQTTGFYQVKTVNNEIIPDVPYAQQYGFSSTIPVGSNVVMISMNGDKNDPIIVADLAEGKDGFIVTPAINGDVLVWTSENNYISLTRTGDNITIKTNGLIINADTTLESGDLTVDIGDIKATAGDVSDSSVTTPSMQEIRDMFNNHAHTAQGATSLTTIPTTQM